MTSRRQSNFFYGWWVVLAVAVGLFMGYVPIIGFTFSIFFVPIAEEMKWSRAEISLAFSISLLVLSVCLPVAGRLVDRVGPRRVILTSVVIFSLGLMSFYYLSPNLWHYYLIYVVIGMVGSGVSPVPYYNVISHWFDRKRGLALGLSMIGVGLSELLTPSFAQALIGTIGWRAAYIVLGIVVAAVTFPVVALFLKERPQQLGLLPDGATEISERAERETGPAQGLTANQAWRTGVFWLMSVGLFLVSMSLTGCLVHLVPMLKDRGMSAANAALAISILGGANLMGRVLTGYLLDRVFASSVAFFFFCGAAVGIFMLLIGATGALAFIATFLIGLGMGAEGDIMAYIVGRYFGLLAFGEIYGYVLAIYTLGAMLGPVVMGLSFDMNGDYKMALTGFVAVTLLGAALMTQLGPYRTWSTAEVGAD
jgi:MFS family permease